VEFAITDPKARTGSYRYTPESERIKRAFIRVLDRDTSILAIAKELGFRSYQTMRKQLSNPIWTGWRESRLKREKLPPGPNGELRSRKVPRLVPIRTKIILQGEPLISKEMFDEVQSILDRINKEHVTRRSGKSKFELSGLLRCPCGQRYYSKHDTRSGKTGYYVCRSGYLSAAKGCGHGYLKRAEIDSAVVELLSARLSNKKVLTELIMAALTPADHGVLRDERDRLRHKLDTLTSRRTKLVDKVVDGLLTDEEARVSMAKLRSEIETATAHLAEVEGRLKVTPIDNLPTVVTSIVALFTSLKFRPADHRKKVIRQIVQDVQISEDRQVASLRLKVGEGRTVSLSLNGTAG
jgi:hypothetical protein